MRQPRRLRGEKKENSRDMVSAESRMALAECAKRASYPFGLLALINSFRGRHNGNGHGA